MESFLSWSRFWVWTSRAFQISHVFNSSICTTRWSTTTIVSNSLTRFRIKSRASLIQSQFWALSLTKLGLKRQRPVKQLMQKKKMCSQKKGLSRMRSSELVWFSCLERLLPKLMPIWVRKLFKRKDWSKRFSKNSFSRQYTPLLVTNLATPNFLKRKRRKLLPPPQTLKAVKQLTNCCSRWLRKVPC